jgi:hypothetical protein
MAVDPQKEKNKPYPTFTMNHEGGIERMNVWRQQARRLLLLAEGDPNVDGDDGIADPVAWAILQVGVCVCEGQHWAADMICKALKKEASASTSEDLKDQLAKARKKGKAKRKTAAQKKAEATRAAARKAVNE